MCRAPGQARMRVSSMPFSLASGGSDWTKKDALPTTFPLEQDLKEQSC